MEILKITLGGRFAHFGIHGTNDKSNRYSFQHIPGGAIKGILGAIAGYAGWNEFQTEDIPEFLFEQTSLKYSVIPRKIKFSSVLHTYNNTTGVNRNDEGSLNLQITEEFLEDVEWDIYLGNVSSKVKEKILADIAIYPLSLGKKGLFLNKFHWEFLEGKKIFTKTFDSIFPLRFLKEKEYMFIYSVDYFVPTEEYTLSEKELQESMEGIEIDGLKLYMNGVG